MNINNKRIKLYVKDTEKAHSIEKIVIEELLNNGFEINNESYDIIISIGGDGTFLKALHKYGFNENTYYIPINAGALGYLSSINGEEVKEFIYNLVNNKYNVKEYNYLKTKIYTKEKEYDLFSVNEFMLRKNDFSSLKLDILVDNTLFNKYVGEGLIISTSRGSTGYNLSVNGPIIDNDLNVLTITPIMPVNNKIYKSLLVPMIISPEKRITIVPSNDTNLSLLIDGKSESVTNITKIEFSLSENTIKCIVPINYNNISNIKDKILDVGE